MTAHCENEWVQHGHGLVLVHLRGIHTLSTTLCTQITDAAFAHLREIKSINIKCCNQKTITDAAFLQLCGIHTLNMIGCKQATITGAAFLHLRGIHKLLRFVVTLPSRWLPLLRSLPRHSMARLLGH